MIFLVRTLPYVLGSSGLEPPTSRLSGARSNQLSYEPLWRWWDSNPWPPACRAGALPTELHPHLVFFVALCLFFQWASSHSLKIEQQSITSYTPIKSPSCLWLAVLLRKEVIQPHLPIRLPCYDFTPVTSFTFGSSFLTVGSLTSGASDSHGVTGGVYKARERIHRGMLIRDY